MLKWLRDVSSHITATTSNYCDVDDKKRLDDYNGDGEEGGEVIKDELRRRRNEDEETDEDGEDEETEDERM